MELVFGAILMATIIFGLLISHDVKFLMMPVMATFAIIPSARFPEYDYYASTAVIAMIVVLAVLFAAALIFFLVRNRKIANPVPLKGLFLSILVFCGVLCLNGIFSERYTVGNFLFTILMLLTMPLVYWIFAAFLQYKKSMMDYFMLCLVGVGLLISAELILAYLTTVHFKAGDIVKESVYLGWGIWTNIGSMLVFLMPACFYFAHSHKNGWIGYVLGLIEFFCIVLSQSRAALLIGALSLALCMIYLCLSGKNKRLNRIMTVSLGAIVLLALPLVFDKVVALLNNFLQKGFDDNGRYDLWVSAWDAFLRSPIFGSGFYDVVRVEGNWHLLESLPDMCHNTILQVLGMSGIVGILAYGYHRFETVKLVVVKRNPIKMFLGICILGFLLFGLLDVVFFIAYPNMIYTLMLLFMQFSELPEEEMYI